MDKERLSTGLLVFLSSSLITLLLVEMVYRFFIFGWDALYVEKMNSVHPLGVSGLIKPSAHPDIVYELKPNLRSFFKLVPFETNSHGLRDKEYEMSKPEKTFRVGVIGDSFTMPSGVRIQDAYHTLLEERLNREQGDLSYEFINFGVGGYSLRQYWGVIKYKTLKHDIDLILVGFCSTNDHIIPPNRVFEQPYRVKKNTYPFSQSFALYGSKLALIKVKTLLRSIKQPFAGHDTGPFSQEQKNYMSQIFSKMSIFSKDNNIPIVIAYLSPRYNRKVAKAKKEIEDIIIGSGLPYFVDVSSSFKGTTFSEYRIYAIDNHPNGKGHKIFADGLYDYLQNMKLLDSRKLKM